MGGVAHLRLQAVVLKERNREPDDQNQAEQRGGSVQNAARRTGLGAGAAGAHGGAVGQQNVVEEVAEEQPLRHFARGRSPAPACGCGCAWRRRR